MSVILEEITGNTVIKMLLFDFWALTIFFVVWKSFLTPPLSMSMTGLSDPPLLCWIPVIGEPGVKEMYGTRKDFEVFITSRPACFC